MSLRTALPVGVAVLGATCIAHAQVDPTDRSGLWRVSAPALLTEGCYDPCLCPISDFGPIQGSFVLARVAIGDVFDFYEVRAMILDAPVAQRQYTGSGNFQYSPFVPTEFMGVDLALSNTEVFHFQGEGQVPASPDSMDLELDRNNRQCFDTVIRLAASRCRSDWDRDGTLAPTDVAAFVLEWRRSIEQGVLDGDYDGNGAVEPVDLASFVGAWLGGLTGGGCS
ncbi:MAG: hypothetical protein KF745_06050 [Phycisphaeraceae bacterium]|nr:hypothetical protein [Phycisphaeraceae bacterium]